VRFFGLMLIGFFLAALLVRPAEYKEHQSIFLLNYDNPFYYRGAF
jgi:hypothetical protein